MASTSVTRSVLIALCALALVSAQTAHAKPSDSTKVFVQPSGGDGDQTSGEPQEGDPPRGFPYPIEIWDFESGLQGWTTTDDTENGNTAGHVQNLAGVPGSRGNSFGDAPDLASTAQGFVGQVLWTGRINSGACGPRFCFPGYDNDLHQLFFKSYIVPPGGGTMRFRYRVDAEAGYDFTRVVVSLAGCPTMTSTGAYALPGTPAERDTLATFTGFVEGTQVLSLTPYANKSICIIFLSDSDAAFSDEDCGYDSRDGLFECDSLVVGNDITTWDAGANGWTIGRTAGVGTVGGVATLASLPNEDPCVASCALDGSVFILGDAVGSTAHPAGQDECMRSPVVDLTAVPSYPAAGYALQFDAYTNMIEDEGIFYFWRVRYSPAEEPDCTCFDASAWSPWMDNGLVYASSAAFCQGAQTYDISHMIPAHAERLQIALGVINTGTAAGNASPYFDNIGVYASPIAAPHVVMQPWEFLQDAYPNASTFAAAKAVAAPIDQALNVRAPYGSTRLGDSLTCAIARSCAPGTDAAEVDILFRVTPGPCINTSHPWWTAYQAQARIASGPYAGFVVARADTAPSDTLPDFVATRVFQSTFHESAPAGGTRYGGLGNWAPYTAGTEGLAIFPDDLFTPGTHIEYVLHSTYIPAKPNGDYYLPDSAWGGNDNERAGALLGNMHWASQGGTYTGTEAFVNEVGVLPFTTKDGSPSGMNCASALPSHCFLYVDKADGRGPQANIENAFRNLQISWDRYDVGASAYGMGNDLGARANPLTSDFHNPGPWPALLEETYRAILWNTGTLTETNFSFGGTAPGADAGNAVGVLDAWVHDTTNGGRFLWVSGTGNAAFLTGGPYRLAFLQNALGATMTEARYGDLNATWGISLTGSPFVCTSGEMYGLGDNACPGRESYAVLAVSPFADWFAAANLAYPDAGGSRYAGIQNVTTTPVTLRTQVDGFSLDQLRQSGVTQGHETNETIARWAAVLLSGCENLCFDSLTAVAIAEAAGSRAMRTTLHPPSVVRTAEAPLAYSLARATRVILRVYDVHGRVRAHVDRGIEPAGEHVAYWDASTAPRGVYFASLETGDGTRSRRRLVVVR